MRPITPSSASVQYPTLTKINYSEWAITIRINLQAQGLWGAIDPCGVDYRQDRTLETRLPQEDGVPPLGYEPCSKAYRVYDPMGGRLHVTRDVGV